MNFYDCLPVAVTAALDLDLPPELLPLTLNNQAAILAGFDADSFDPSWH